MKKARLTSAQDNTAQPTPKRDRLKSRPSRPSLVTDKKDETAEDGSYDSNVNQSASSGIGITNVQNEEHPTVGDINLAANNLPERPTDKPE